MEVNGGWNQPVERNWEIYQGYEPAAQAEREPLNDVSQLLVQQMGLSQEQVGHLQDQAAQQNIQIDNYITEAFQVFKADQRGEPVQRGGRSAPAKPPRSLSKIYVDSTRAIAENAVQRQLQAVKTKLGRRMMVLKEEIAKKEERIHSLHENVDTIGYSDLTASEQGIALHYEDEANRSEEQAELARLQRELAERTAELAGVEKAILSVSKDISAAAKGEVSPQLKVMETRIEKMTIDHAQKIAEKENRITTLQAQLKQASKTNPGVKVMLAAVGLLGAVAIGMVAFGLFNNGLVSIPQLSPDQLRQLKGLAEIGGAIGAAIVFVAGATAVSKGVGKIKSFLGSPKEV